ncbi:MAG: hypothetical protein KGR26_12565, partial [Cyanobacteria bacterium REEB65]|nr:hypothetical protein [Cyanobacteria bacterium REEB65]
PPAGLGTVRVSPVMSAVVPESGYHVEYAQADVSQLVVGLFERSTAASTVPLLGYFTTDGATPSTSNPLSAAAFSALQGALGSTVSVGSADKTALRRYLFAVVDDPADRPSPVVLSGFPLVSAAAPVHAYNLFACALSASGKVIGYFEEDLTAADLASGVVLPVALSYGGLGGLDLGATVEGTPSAPLASASAFEIGLFDPSSTPMLGALFNNSVSAPFDGSRSWFAALRSYLVSQGESSSQVADPHRYLIDEYTQQASAGIAVARFADVPPGTYSAFALVVRNGQASMGNRYASGISVTASGTATTSLGAVLTGPSIWAIGGNGATGLTPGTGTALATAISGPCGVAADGAGNVYFSDATLQVVQEINAAGLLSIVAGTGTAGSSGDGGPATSAQLKAPCGLALSATGDLYVADSGNNSIRRITSGTISTVAAGLIGPMGVAVDSAGNLFIADTGKNSVQEIPAATGTKYGVAMTAGTLATVAGTGTATFGGDGGPA